MPDNLALIPVPHGTWVDLYDLSGIPVGQPLVVENTGACDIYLAVQAAQPPADHKSFNILKRDDDIRLANTLGDAGAWAFCNASDGLISVAEREGFQPLLNSALHDGLGNPIKSLSGALDVHVADVHNVVINRYIHQDTATVTTFAVASAANSYIIEVADSTGFAANDFLHVNTSVAENTHPQITDVTGNVLTLDRRLDFAHAIGDVITKVIVDMALAGQAGTIAAHQIYSEGPEPGEVWHITRLLFSMVHGTAGDLGLFGNLPVLANGALLRVNSNGQFGTLTNWKTNADIKTDMFDVQFDSRSGGQGQFGTSGRGTFTETGAVLRLDGDQGDRFEVHVQDDLTALDFFAMKIQGHVEGL